MKKIMSKKTPVWIAHINGAALDLAARSYGPLAITRTFRGFLSFPGDNKTYAVTHVPTGYAIQDYLPWATAKIACEALMKSDIPWGKLTLKNCKRYGKRIAAILKAVSPDLVA